MPVNVISVSDFGASGNGLDNDAPAINKALQSAQSKGRAVFMPSGIYRVESTIQVPPFVTLFSECPTSDVSSHSCMIVGTLSLDPVVSLYGGSGSAAMSLRNIGITREDGNIPPHVRGLVIDQTDHTIIEDVYLWRHAVGCEVHGQLGVKLNRVTTSRITEAHIDLTGGPEITLIDCRMGRNGVSELHCQAFLRIAGNVDTMTMLRGQFNGSADYGVLWLNYASPNGIFYFTNCHAEGWSAAFLVGGHGISQKIQRIIITGCTITSSDSALQLVGGTLMKNLYEFIANSNLFACSLDFDQQEAFIITGNRFIGSVNINCGTGTFVGNVLYSSANLMGQMQGVVFLGNCFESPTARLSDNSTGQRVILGNVTRSS